VKKSRGKFMGVVRYIPNSYFIRQLRRFRPPGAECLVFSERGTKKEANRRRRRGEKDPFDDFVQENCTVELSGPLEDVWRAAMRSDVFIMSR